jgi:hypothetical protein
MHPRKLFSLIFVLYIGVSTGVVWAAGVSSLETVNAHTRINAYDGPSTCVTCHTEAAREMFQSVHYQWTGPTPNVPNINGNAGKADLGFNTYCGTVVTSRRVACWACHVGNGGVPTSQVSADQLNNIDCLMCHQENYERKPAPPFETISFIGFDNILRRWTLPIEDAVGNFKFEPDPSKMSISIVEAARTVHTPNRATCLRCHAYAAGTDCGKRGDLGTATVNPPKNAEIHMSPEGENLSCQDCHQFNKHRVLGRGLDIRPNDRPERLTCFSGGCHSQTPHGDKKLDDHTARVACQTCHIPLFANLNSTEISRNWEIPVFAAGLFNGQGGFKAEEVRDSNIIPTYKWFDGTSQVYALGQVPSKNAAGQFEFGVPNGGVNSVNAMIYPMKEHVSNSAMSNTSGEIIPHSTATFFFTGDFDRAVMAASQDDYRMVDIHTFQTINHGVKPADNALDCGQCHRDLSEGQLPRMDLQGQLGYQLKGDPLQVCTQCHKLKASKGFKEDHAIHVTEERFDCAWCHNFSRPERKLGNTSKRSRNGQSNLQGDGIGRRWEMGRRR